MTFLPASFRDHDARVLESDGPRILRALSPPALAEREAVERSGLHREIVRRILPFDARTMPDPPNRRVVEQNGLRNDLEKIGPRIATDEVRQLVGDDRIDVARTKTGCEPRREEDDWLEHAREKRRP